LLEAIKKAILRAPGGLSKDRWMTKAIYMKNVLFKNQFNLSSLPLLHL